MEIVDHLSTLLACVPNIKSNRMLHMVEDSMWRNLNIRRNLSRIRSEREEAKAIIHMVALNPRYLDIAVSPNGLELYSNDISSGMVRLNVPLTHGKYYFESKYTLSTTCVASYIQIVEMTSSSSSDMFKQYNTVGSS